MVPFPDTSASNPYPCKVKVPEPKNQYSCILIAEKTKKPRDHGREAF